MANKPVLLDAHGRPIRRATLTQELMAPTMGGVRSPIAGSPADGLTPVILANILRAADQGDGIRYLELAEIIEERDLHYLGVLGTRRRSVSQIEITVEPADESAAAQKHAKLVEDWLDRDELQGEIFNILDAIGKGFSLTEIVWETSMGDWLPSRLELRDPRWIRFDRVDLRTPLRLDEHGAEVPLEGGRFIWADMMGAKSGLPLRGGLARAVLWAYLFKKYTERDWAVFTQTYGQPLRVGKFGPGASEADRDTLFRAVANIAGDCAAIIPESMAIEFIETGNLSATGQLYRERAEYLDKQVSKAVLGQTATTDAETGGLGSGKEHREVQQDIETADARGLATVLNRDLVRPMVMLNFGPQARYPRLRIAREEPEDLAAFAAAVTPFIDRGLKVAEQDVLDKFGLAAPEAGAALLRPVRAGSGPQDALGTDPGGPASPSEGQRAPSEPRPELQSATTPGDTAGPSAARSAPLSEMRDLARAGVEATDPEVARILATLEAMVSKAGSLEELREMLVAAYPKLGIEGVADRMAEAMAAARAAGRADVAAEAE